MQYQVTNNTDQPFVGSFDGNPISIAPGETQVVSEGLARHCFAAGLSRAEKIETIVRHGWVRASTDIERGLTRLEGFVVRPFDPQPDADDVAPAPAAEPAVAATAAPAPEKVASAADPAPEEAASAADPAPGAGGQ